MLFQQKIFIIVKEAKIYVPCRRHTQLKNLETSLQNSGKMNASWPFSKIYRGSHWNYELWKSLSQEKKSNPLKFLQRSLFNLAPETSNKTFCTHSGCWKSQRSLSHWRACTYCAIPLFHWLRIHKATSSLPFGNMSAFSTVRWLSKTLEKSRKLKTCQFQNAVQLKWQRKASMCRLHLMLNALYNSYYILPV